MGESPLKSHFEIKFYVRVNYRVSNNVFDRHFKIQLSDTVLFIFYENFIEETIYVL